MPHFIMENCIGCTVCAQKCPVFCIHGENKELFYIDDSICIDCGVCAAWCPVEAIADPTGFVPPVKKAKDIPRAYVVDELCTACEYCIDICPFDCITLEDDPNALFWRVVRVHEKSCVSCKLCETVCAKGAILIDRDTPFLEFMQAG